jgi:hypothetical protein
MNKMKIKTSYIKLLESNTSYRSDILDSLSGYDKLVYSSDLRDFLDNFIDQHFHKFKEFENEYFYEDEDEIITIIIPIFRRLYGKMFITPPSILLDKKEKLELFKLSFNIEYFCEYLINMLNYNRKALEKFEYLDKTNEIITLIVDNYIAYLIEYVNNSENIKLDIRHLKLKNIL